LRARLARLVLWTMPVIAAVPRCAAALEINEATRAQLEQLSGVGVDLAGRILDERAKAPFSDWNDLTRRVKGLKRQRAAGLSGQGLTVQGRAAQPEQIDPAAVLPAARPITVAPTGSAPASALAPAEDHLQALPLVPLPP
jgi:competence protein ComEA